MSYLLLNGKTTADKIISSVAEKIAILQPHIAVIVVGSDPASHLYVKMKQKKCDEIGISNDIINLPEDISYDRFINQVHKLNHDSEINGYLIQLPLPSHLQEKLPQIIREMDPYKDIDGFHAYNLGKMFVSQDFEDLPPATPLGVIKLLDEYKIDLAGKEVVIVGASNLVGKPLGIMLTNRSATVTVCHKSTKDLAFHTKRADILIVAVGKANLIKKDMIKEGVVIVDIGINKVDSKTVGDVDFEDVKDKTEAITPVPGGVGPMTIAALILNTIRATEKQTLP